MKIAIALATAAVLLVVASPVSGQARIHVAVGVVAPPVHAHVVIGAIPYRVLPPPRVIYGTPRYHGRYPRARVVVIVPPRHVHRHHPHVRYRRYRD